ncbi:MAG: cytochrome c oxidase assembly protein [Verrucomicrobia bacterium]|nr:cytochrome c oxidase assembly protein [Verrucomicrobiota bacterium]
MEDPVNAVFSSWTIPIGPTFAILVSFILYVRGWIALLFRVPHRFPLWRLFSFAAGLSTIFVAIASPLDAFGGLMLQVHMIQHLLLMMVAPPLILAGAPYLPILSGLPRIVAREVVGPFLIWTPVKRIGDALLNPVFCWIAFTASNVLWHVPVCYELALNSPAWHQVEHLSFLLTGLMFWWHILLPWPSRAAWPRWAMIPYLVLADLQNTGLAAFLTFYDRVLYPTYEHVPRLWGSNPLDEQVIAGTIMWVPGSIIFLVPAAIIAIRFLSPKPNVQFANNVRAQPEPRPEGELATLLRKAGLGPHPSRRLFDLFRIPMTGRGLRSKAFRRGMQVVMLILAIAVLLDGFLGPPVAAMNLAGVLPWTHWRGFTVIALLFAGNFFCMVCPFVLVRDLGRRWLPEKWTWPRSLRNKWLPVFLVTLYFWTYEAFSLWNSPWLTAWIILAYFLAALLIDGFFQGGTFCKYVCPIGQFHFVQSMLSPLEVKVREPEVCRKCKTLDCIRGRSDQRGCELKLFQPKKKGNMDCTFCMDCVDACPHDNVGLIAVTPGKDLWTGEKRSSIGSFSSRFDLAVLVFILVFGALANAAGMIAPVAGLLDRARFLFGLQRPVLIALFLAATIFLIPALAICLAGFLSRHLGRLQVPLKLFISDFAMTMVPLGFATWLAHFIFHLFTSSNMPIPVIERIAADLHLTSFGKPDWGIASWGVPQLLDFEILFLDLGLLGSLYAGWRVAQRYGNSENKSFGIFIPWSLLYILFFLVAIWILFQPMDLRGTMMS